MKKPRFLRMRLRPLRLMRRLLVLRLWLRLREFFLILRLLRGAARRVRRVRLFDTRRFALERRRVRRAFLRWLRLRPFFLTRRLLRLRRFGVSFFALERLRRLRLGAFFATEETRLRLRLRVAFGAADRRLRLRVTLEVERRRLAESRRLRLRLGAAERLARRRFLFTVVLRALERRLRFVAFDFAFLRMAAPWGAAFRLRPLASRGRRRRFDARRLGVWDELEPLELPRRAAARARDLAANASRAAICLGDAARRFLRMGDSLRVDALAPSARRARLRRSPGDVMPPMASRAVRFRLRNAPRPLIAAIAVTPGFGVWARA